MKFNLSFLRSKHFDIRDFGFLNQYPSHACFLPSVVFTKDCPEMDRKVMFFLSLKLKENRVFQLQDWNEKVIKINLHIYWAKIL